MAVQAAAAAVQAASNVIDLTREPVVIDLTQDMDVDPIPPPPAQPIPIPPPPAPLLALDNGDAWAQQLSMELQREKQWLYGAQQEQMADIDRRREAIAERAGVKEATKEKRSLDAKQVNRDNEQNSHRAARTEIFMSKRRAMSDRVIPAPADVEHKADEPSYVEHKSDEPPPAAEPPPAREEVLPPRENAEERGRQIMKDRLRGIVKRKIKAMQDGGTPISADRIVSAMKRQYLPGDEEGFKYQGVTGDEALFKEIIKEIMREEARAM